MSGPHMSRRRPPVTSARAAKSYRCSSRWNQSVIASSPLRAGVGPCTAGADSMPARRSAKVLDDHDVRRGARHLGVENPPSIGTHHEAALIVRDFPGERRNVSRLTCGEVVELERGGGGKVRLVQIVNAIVLDEPVGTS